MATRFQNVVSGVITGIFIKKALDNDAIQDFDLIIDGLYMSNLEQSCHPSLLIKHKITHVLSVCQAKNAFENGLDDAFSGIELSDIQQELVQKWKSEWNGIVYERVAIPDKPKVDITARFAKTIRFLKAVLSQPDNKVLLHCQAGISRSATICLAFLMSRGMQLDEAFIHLRGKRACIRPNNGFAAALIRYNEELYPGIDCPQFKEALGL